MALTLMYQLSGAYEPSYDRQCHASTIARLAIMVQTRRTAKHGEL